MVETLDDYYANGTLRRIDEYIDITSSQIDAALPYQQVTFEYQGRGTKLAALYEQAENVGWGTETFEIDNEILGNPYKISVGFEHIQFETVTGNRRTNRILYRRQQRAVYWYAFNILPRAHYKRNGY
jgi:hypothetical protein